MKTLSKKRNVTFLDDVFLTVEVKAVLVLSGGLQNTKEESGRKGSKWQVLPSVYFYG